MQQLQQWQGGWHENGSISNLYSSISVCVWTEPSWTNVILHYFFWKHVQEPHFTMSALSADQERMRHNSSWKGLKIHPFVLSLLWQHFSIGLWHSNKHGCGKCWQKKLACEDVSFLQTCDNVLSILECLQEILRQSCEQATIQLSWLWQGSLDLLPWRINAISSCGKIIMIWACEACTMNKKGLQTTNVAMMHWIQGSL